MQAQNIFLRIAKILGKAILGLLLVLLTALALIHIPIVQEKITRVVSNYLSSKMEARVEIQRIDFSILGNVSIEDVKVWDPMSNPIFSAQKIEVASSIYNLVRGDFIFDKVLIAGFDGHLIQREEGLNIQFILDAFKPTEKSSTTKSNPVTLQFKNIQLENSVFEFTSMVSGTTVSVNLGTFTGQEAEFSTNPMTIKADQAIIERSIVNVLSLHHPDTLITLTSENNNLLSPDFGTGIVFEIRDLQLKDDEFSFHQDQITTTRKFDPSHIALKNIQLSLSDILMREDTLAADLQSLSAHLPGFNIDAARGNVESNKNQMVLSEFHLASNTNELNADFTGGYDLNSANDADHAHVEIAASGRINPSDFAYFFNDSVMNQFSHWGSTELTLAGNYRQGKGKIKTLNLKTGSSELHAEGMVYDVLDPEKIHWKDLTVGASMGSDFKKTITPFIRTINIPPSVTLQLKSSGNLKKLYADGKVFTTWGNVKAVGEILQQTGNIGMDINLTGEKVDLGKWMNVSVLGPIDLAVNTKGIIGNDTDIEINGLITEIVLLDQSVHHVDFQSWIGKTNATVAMDVADPDYRSEIHSEISFEGPLTFTSDVQLDSFKLGSLVRMDSSLSISGSLRSKITIDQSTVEGNVEGRRILFQNQSMEYLLDTMVFDALISPTSTEFHYSSDDEKGDLVANFGIEDSPKIIQTWSRNILKAPGNTIQPTGDRAVNFNMELENANLFKLLGIDVDDFSSLKVTGEFDEQKQTTSLQATSGKFKGYGISLDTLNTNLRVVRDSASARMNAKNLFYHDTPLGNLDFDILTQGDTAISNLLLSHDTSTLLGLRARILPTDSGAFVYADHLRAFDHDYIIDPKNSVHIGNKNFVLNHFLISRDNMEINLEGDLNAFDVSLKHVDLVPLNFLVSPDTTLINEGYLTGKISYSREHQLNLKATIDSLSLYHSNPLTITASAVSDGNRVPFQFLLTNASNKIDLKGHYLSDNTEVDASLLLDINNLELFDFLVSEVIDEMNGAIKGKASISGPIKTPAVKGHLRFIDMGLTTVNPKLTFHVQDDRIELDNSSLVFNHFTLYDKEQHPLIIDGNVTSKDYRSLAYELHINSDQYTLINNPDSTSGKLRGLLVMDSDIKLKGNEKDTNIEANLTIKDATDLTFVNSKGGIELLKAEGIIDFIDPAQLLDSAAHEPSTNFYDSLISSLPQFNLNSKVTIEDKAVLRVVIDEQSGDYIEASGSANLELGYDRTGNLQLSGNYTIKKGVYRLSFYDLVKKNFKLVQGSSITWRGSPKNGDLSIKAAHTVESNSLGLIGHEIGENEKSIYKRSLDYEVGININGTIEKPIISFSLDLPQNEKVNYPVLANKLDRLRQPEYASELNKQVFGLLVLGGFLPESSADVNSSVIATTALSNSVNSLLASQLNRFASQYIKGVNIDVGIQSFSDYSAPGGKTQTAMDFRVSKKIMNDRLSFEIGGDFDINKDQSGGNTGKNYRGDIAIIYDLTGNGDKQLKLFNNETYDIIYQEIRNTGISLMFIREFASKEENKKEKENKKETKNK